MRKICPFGLLLIFVSCSVSNLQKSYLGNHTYRYTLIKSTTDSLLHYSDDRMNFNFSITDKEIDFTAKNNTDEPLKLIWDEASNRKIW